MPPPLPLLTVYTLREEEEIRLLIAVDGGAGHMLREFNGIVVWLVDSLLVQRGVWVTGLLLAVNE